MTTAIASAPARTRRRRAPAAPRPPRPSQRRRVGSVLTGLAALIVFVASVFPVYWMVNTSFQPNAQVRGSEIHFWPDDGTLDNYANVDRSAIRGRRSCPPWGTRCDQFLITVVVALVFAFLAALAVTRFRFRSRRRPSSSRSSSSR